jgi:hypothetical protein
MRIMMVVMMVMVMIVIMMISNGVSEGYHSTGSTWIRRLVTIASASKLLQASCHLLAKAYTHSECSICQTFECKTPFDPKCCCLKCGFLKQTVK